MQAEVVCVHTREGLLYLRSPLRETLPILRPSDPTQVQFILPAGVLQLTGRVSGPRSIEVDGVRCPAWELEVDLDAVSLRNRREHYRISVTLKGEIFPFTAEEFRACAGELPLQAPLGAEVLLHLQDIGNLRSDRRHPCVVRDLSLGGARVSTTGPAVEAGQAALMDVALGPEDRLRNLLCEVVERRRTEASPSFEVELRLRFLHLSVKEEGRLSRHIIEVQRELIRKGIRS